MMRWKARGIALSWAEELVDEGDEFSNGSSYECCVSSSEEEPRTDLSSSGFWDDYSRERYCLRLREYEIRSYSALKDVDSRSVVRY
ncbi:hypothetical protein OROGR_014993 [Orobanche gracilis]